MYRLCDMSVIVKTAAIQDEEMEEAEPENGMGKSVANSPAKARWGGKDKVAVHTAKEINIHMGGRFRRLRCNIRLRGGSEFLL